MIPWINSTSARPQNSEDQRRRLTGPYDWPGTETSRITEPRAVSRRACGASQPVCPGHRAHPPTLSSGVRAVGWQGQHARAYSARRAVLAPGGGAWACYRNERPRSSGPAPPDSVERLRHRPGSDLFALRAARKPTPAADSRASGVSEPLRSTGSVRTVRRFNHSLGRFQDRRPNGVGPPQSTRATGLGGECDCRRCHPES
jgi:hypothetical protein